MLDLFPLLYLATSLHGELYAVKMETLSVEKLSKLLEEKNTPESVVQLLKGMCSLVCGINFILYVYFTYLIFLFTSLPWAPVS